MSKLVIMGIFAFIALLVLWRFAAKGRGRRYAHSKKAFEERLRKTSSETREQMLSAGVAEQMQPIAAAIRELLEFAGNPPGYALLEEGRTVRLQIPAGEVRIDFGFSRMRMALRHKAAQPRVCWQISGPGKERKEYVELADAVIHLKRVISGAHSPARDGTAWSRFP